MGIICYNNLLQNILFGANQGIQLAKILSFQDKKTSAPRDILRKVPIRPKNADVRSREYLTIDEVQALMKAAGSVGRHRHRDKTLILIMFRHGLRVSEAVNLRYDQADFKSGQIHINRLKNGRAATHYLEGDEMRALRRLKRESPVNPFIFVTERGGPMTRSTIGKLIKRAGEIAGIEFPVHPHMLRHACGYYLANKGVDTRTIQDLLGHVSIIHTVRYTELSPHKFRGLWD
jgi:type 1 fimbriae regulatory protein FimB/type 1 fimbriae regulatory protein FimE